MWIDRAVVEVRAGNGGNGMIAFHREKYIAKGGPSGGNGGRGGSIIFRASSGINTLVAFRHSRVISADNGQKGMGKNQYGRGASDVIVDIPVGTVVIDAESKEVIADFDEEGKTVVVAKGGRGGRGNACFKSPQNRTPRIAENGLPGEKKKLILELKLLADVGFLGLPSVGKSTLLSIISNAQPEIADYPFTTLHPNLGVVEVGDGRSFVAADLPGLIEGAHEGKGLGLQFLRHVERCRVLLHLVSMSGERDPVEDYRAILKELKAYSPQLAKRPMIVVATKMDEEGAEERLKEFKRHVRKKVVAISALLDEGIQKLLYLVADTLDATPKTPLYQEQTMDEKVYQAKEEPTYDVIRIAPHTFRIVGEKVERDYDRMNLSTDEGILRLLSYLRKLDVDTLLKKKGAVDGDTVFLCDFEFEYLS